MYHIPQLLCTLYKSRGELEEEAGSTDLGGKKKRRRRSKRQEKDKEEREKKIRLNVVNEDYG